ncbi:hypothetical protein Cgig2_000901 [Carnegiea gigantea]|uniref:Reverse transcriptase n=1 Tax=Carnegiea gigantea TaxID=171969 RepID=A0A9Q1GG24_9CARY|nr:hypothetical protein Cgig2_000901 [Carnegiea gigantea]
MLIDIPLKEEFPAYIEFANDKDVLIRQSVLYEWQPIKCKHCHMYGRLKDQCRKKQAPRKVWRVKQPSPASDPPRSTPQTTADAKGFTSLQQIGVIGLLETKIKIHNFGKVADRLFRGWNMVHNFVPNNHRPILVAWKPQWYTLRQISQSDQHLHCLVKFQTTMQHFYLTFIYGNNHESPRQDLWAELEHIALDMNELDAYWEILNRIGGKPIQDHEVKSFTECIHSCGLQELPSRGSYFSWANKTIWSIINRVFINALWYLHFDFSQVLYMSHSLADHTPLLLHLINRPKPRKAFHFCEMWTRDPSFQTIIHNMMPTVTHNLGQQLDKYHDLRTQQLKAREALERIQMNLQASPNNEQLKLAETQAREHYTSITSSALAIIK